MAKGTVVYQFLSNFNVHMNNVEILIKWICESAFLTSSHDGYAAGQQINLVAQGVCKWTKN